MKRNLVSRYVATGLAAMCLFLVTGCATKDTVSSRFSRLEDNIYAAKTAGAELYAPTHLQAAESRLEAAREAVKAEDMVSAARFVDEAMVDADYARAKAHTEKAKNDAMKLREEIQSLRNEIRIISITPQKIQ